MRELATTRPKHLIPVIGRPFISHVLDRLVAAGIQRMILVIGHLREVWTDYLREQPYDLTIVDQCRILGDKYGTSCPIEAAASVLDNESFLAVNGDNLYSPDDIRALLVDDAFTYVAGLKHEHPERYGVLVPRPDGTLERIEEKPAVYVGDLINTSLYKFTPEVLPIVQGLKKSPRGEYEITDAVSALAKQNRVRIHMLREYWKDFGRPEDIAIMEEFIRTHPIGSSTRP